MKKIILLAALGLLSFRPEDPVIIHRLIVLPESRLTISGKTNVNQFQCVIARYVGSDTLVLHEGMRQTRPVFVQGALQLNASGFDCGMALMTSDFQKTIKSKEYPSITIDFISFEKMPVYSQQKEKFKGILKITISGVTKVFEIVCDIKAKPSGVIELQGTHAVTFSDFGLKAPSRMLGAVKVDKNLTVTFQLELKLDPGA